MRYENTSPLKPPAEGSEELTLLVAKDASVSQELQSVAGVPEASCLKVKLGERLGKGKHSEVCYAVVVSAPDDSSFKVGDPIAVRESKEKKNADKQLSIGDDDQYQYSLTAEKDGTVYYYTVAPYIEIPGAKHLLDNRRNYPYKSKSFFYTIFPMIALLAKLVKFNERYEHGDLHLENVALGARADTLGFNAAVYDFDRTLTREAEGSFPLFPDVLYPSEHVPAQAIQRSSQNFDVYSLAFSILMWICPDEHAELDLKTQLKGVNIEAQPKIGEGPVDHDERAAYEFEAYRVYTQRLQELAKDLLEKNKPEDIDQATYEKWCDFVIGMLAHDPDRRPNSKEVLQFFLQIAKQYAISSQALFWLEMPLDDERNISQIEVFWDLVDEPVGALKGEQQADRIDVVQDDRELGKDDCTAESSKQEFSSSQIDVPEYLLKPLQVRQLYAYFTESLQKSVDDFCAYLLSGLGNDAYRCWLAAGELDEPSASVEDEGSGKAVESGVLPDVPELPIKKATSPAEQVRSFFKEVILSRKATSDSDGLEDVSDAPVSPSEFLTISLEPEPRADKGAPIKALPLPKDFLQRLQDKGYLQFLKHFWKSEYSKAKSEQEFKHALAVSLLNYIFSSPDAELAWDKISLDIKKELFRNLDVQMLEQGQRWSIDSRIILHMLRSLDSLRTASDEFQNVVKIAKEYCADTERYIELFERAVDSGNCAFEQRGSEDEKKWQPKFPPGFSNVFKNTFRENLDAVMLLMKKYPGGARDILNHVIDWEGSSPVYDLSDVLEKIGALDESDTQRAVARAFLLKILATSGYGVSWLEKYSNENLQSLWRFARDVDSESQLDISVFNKIRSVYVYAREQSFASHDDFFLLNALEFSSRNDIPEDFWGAKGFDFAGSDQYSSGCDRSSFLSLLISFSKDDFLKKIRAIFRRLQGDLELQGFKLDEFLHDAIKFKKLGYSDDLTNEEFLSLGFNFEDNQLQNEPNPSQYYLLAAHLRLKVSSTEDEGDINNTLATQVTDLAKQVDIDQRVCGISRRVKPAQATDLGRSVYQAAVKLTAPRRAQLKQDSPDIQNIMKHQKDYRWSFKSRRAMKTLLITFKAALLGAAVGFLVGFLIGVITGPGAIPAAAAGAFFGWKSGCIIGGSAAGVGLATGGVRLWKMPRPAASDQINRVVETAVTPSGAQ